MTICYGKQVPFLNDYLKVPCMKRLQGVGMNCGMNYTQFPIFKNIPFYSRYQHSLGCAIATYHFTHDKRQTLASLFHDVATPVFAHTIDFMTGDYLHQEATEKNTTTLLQNDAILMALLERDHIKLSQIDNYHIYPICDNKTPRLSIDRLEYTLDNAYYYGFASPGTLQACFDDLYVGHNEDGEKELTFAHEDIALTFALLALQCGYVYMSDNDRYSMDRLGRLTKKALEEGIIKDFISTHHGTGLTKYFYINYCNAHPDENVNKELFQYPGPNPFTREQAILMMADTVEAASRSLNEYTEESISTLINKLIDGQVAEGFFKECPITFRDIALAKVVLTERLKSIYHTRISYPHLNK